MVAGRAALQKKIMPMLRKIGEPTDGNKQAWNTTFTKIWKKSTDFLQHFPHKVDGGMTMKKRAHTQNEHELDVSICVQQTYSSAIWSQASFILYLCLYNLRTSYMNG